MEKFAQRVRDGAFYEAHMLLKTRVSRLVRGRKYDEAARLVVEGASILLRHGQGGSGTDLVLYLLEIYTEAGKGADGEVVATLVQLLQLVSPAEPNLKDVVTAMNNWTIAHGSYKFGDPQLHNSIALKLLEAECAYEAERYFVLGTFESLEHYLQLMWSWFEQSDSPLEDVSTFALRVALNYLFIGNVKYAADIQQRFIKLFLDSGCSQDVAYELKEKPLPDEKGPFRMYYFPQLPALNMAQLLLLACQTGHAALFQSLKEQYPDVAQQYAEPFQFLGAEYFGIETPRKVNLLQDMMSGLFK